jgi:hypothetical protein
MPGGMSAPSPSTTTNNNNAPAVTAGASANNPAAATQGINTFTSLNAGSSTDLDFFNMDFPGSSDAFGFDMTFPDRDGFGDDFGHWFNGPDEMPGLDLK